MNVRKGDWAICKDNPLIQGRVMRCVYRRGFYATLMFRRDRDGLTLVGGQDTSAIRGCQYARLKTRWGFFQIPANRVRVLRRAGN
jgi:hypothetical protein